MQEHLQPIEHKEKIKIYSSDLDNSHYIFLDLPPNELKIDDCKEVREWQGYHLIDYVAKTRFSVEESELLELNEYCNSEGNRIVEIWDFFRCICVFYIKNELYYFDFLQKFCSMRANLFRYECDLKKLLKDEDEDE